jgi:hypothetical protein
LKPSPVSGCIRADIEVPNTAIDKVSKAVLACYP